MPSLDKLAQEIASEASEEASQILKLAEAEAAKIIQQAEEESKSIVSASVSDAEYRAEQIRKGLVAGSRQQMQQRRLLNQRDGLQSLRAAVEEAIASTSLKGRSAMLKSLLSEAKKQMGEGTICPVEVDRKALEKIADKYDMGESIPGLGGFSVESKDGSMSIDFRFDERLNTLWSEMIGDARDMLYGS